MDVLSHIPRAAAKTSLPENLVEAVKELSRGENVTLFTTFLAAFQLLLYRLSGQEDILIGAPIAGRNRIETDDEPWKAERRGEEPAIAVL